MQDLLLPALAQRNEQLKQAEVTAARLQQQLQQEQAAFEEQLSAAVSGQRAAEVRAAKAREAGARQANRYEVSSSTPGCGCCVCCGGGSGWQHACTTIQVAPAAGQHPDGGGGAGSSSNTTQLQTQPSEALQQCCCLSWGPCALSGVCTLAVWLVVPAG